MAGVSEGIYYNGIRYDTEAQVLAAIQQERRDREQQEEVRKERERQREYQERLRQEEALRVSATPSSVSGLSSALNVPTVSPQVGAQGGPLITQTGYENERLAQQQAEVARQQQEQQAVIEQRMAAAADAARRGQMELAAKLQADAEARRLGMLSTLKTTAGGIAPPAVTHAGIGPTDEVAARGAAFARAKEQAGRTALSSLKALQDVVESQGLMGSSIEAARAGEIVGGARADVGDFTTEQLISDLNRAAEISDLSYQGGITQRGQDISLLPSLLGLITAGGGLY